MNDLSPLGTLDRFVSATFKSELQESTGVDPTLPGADSTRARVIQNLLERLGLLRDGKPTLEAQQVLDKYPLKNVG
jgi:hypothetical protein